MIKRGTKASQERPPGLERRDAQAARESQRSTRQYAEPAVAGEAEASAAPYNSHDQAASTDDSVTDVEEG